ncbi:hypothetical protein [Citricoccus sp. I39-566]|uniref:hypothetical protein n=1 Tax=Citricoccus sp. I39-566 TaxID=3073268 RepID=UPI00286C0624|nr:hypothetical protein [Citricoccus sp. I39-566]WMY77713.1 hypothetical protein RE421_12890 [Citricoccus sp. I39-566]
MSTSSRQPAAGSPHPHTGRSRPPAVMALTGVLLLQALAVLGTAVGSVLAIGTGALGVGAQIFLAVLFVLAGVWIGATGLGLWIGRPWTRAAVVVIELFAVILSINFFTGGSPATGLAFLLPAAAALLLMFTRQVAEHLAGLDH